MCNEKELVECVPYFYQGVNSFPKAPVVSFLYLIGQNWVTCISLGQSLTEVSPCYCMTGGVHFPSTHCCTPNTWTTVRLCWQGRFWLDSQQCGLQQHWEKIENRAPVNPGIYLVDSNLESREKILPYMLWVVQLQTHPLGDQAADNNIKLLPRTNWKSDIKPFPSLSQNLSTLLNCIRTQMGEKEL